MSIARHHAEWLSLVEVSGPFLSMPVLLRVFPQGLAAHDPEVSRAVRRAHEEWQDNQQGLRPDPAMSTGKRCGRTQRALEGHSVSLSRVVWVGAGQIGQEHGLPQVGEEPGAHPSYLSVVLGAETLGVDLLPCGAALLLA
jgi:hypothetical protein